MKVEATKPLYDENKKPILEEDGKTQKAMRAEVDYNFGENLKEAVDLYGETVVHSAYVAEGKIQVQNLVRRLLEKGADQDAIEKELATYKIGESRKVTVDPAKAIYSRIPTMTPEEKKALIAELMAKGK